MTTGNAFEFFIQWHLTERCNLRCLHCYQRGSKVSELPFDHIETVIGEITEMVEGWSAAYDIAFNLSYNVTGGEPYLRSDLFEILERIRKREAHFFILTNGTLITRDMALRTAESGAAGVQVSLEGPEHIHDEIRGKGSFARAMKGVRYLVSSGLSVTLNTTLSQLNAGYIKDLAAIARGCGVRRLGFARLVPAGRGGALWGRMLDSEGLRSVYSQLSSMETGDLEIVMGDPIASQMQGVSGPKDQASNLALSGCAVAVSGMTFLSDGTIVPCRRLPIPIGHVVKDNLREVWATSPVLNRLRDRGAYRGKCGGCERWTVCRGCRAIAHACSKSEQEGYLDTDPQCFL